MGLSSKYGLQILTIWLVQKALSWMVTKEPLWLVSEKADGDIAEQLQLDLDGKSQSYW